MNVDSPREQEPPQDLLDRAVRGELCASERASIDRHLADCSLCAIEIETARVLRASMAPEERDEVLYRQLIDGAMERLRQRETVGERMKRWARDYLPLRPAIRYSALGVAAALVVVFAMHQWGAPSSVATIAPMRPLTLEDGSEVIPTSVAATVHVVEQSPTRTTVRLRAGSAQFRVRHDNHRLFRVDTGVVIIEDVGTAFQVTHEDTGRVRVAVSEGRVAIIYPGSATRTELTVGDDRVFSPQPVIAKTPPPLGNSPDPEPPVVPTAAASRPRASDEPASLLAAADLARRTGNPHAAIAPLRRLVDNYPKDPRAPSAAFTLGWVLLTDLNRPREAAVAFAKAEHHAPKGMLAEDAAAQVAQAWQKAGDRHKAAQAARHYQQRYPTGRHRPLMRALAGEP